MTNDSSFVVRLPKEDLEALNKATEKNAVNRAELLRQWIKNYVEENKQKG